MIHLLLLLICESLLLLVFFLYQHCGAQSSRCRVRRSLLLFSSHNIGEGESSLVLLLFRVILHERERGWCRLPRGRQKEGRAALTRKQAHSCARWIHSVTHPPTKRAVVGIQRLFEQVRTCRAQHRMWRGWFWQEEGRKAYL